MTDRSNILCILNILREYSDADHILSTKEISSKLEKLYDHSADRRTIYNCIDDLIELGYSISKYEDNHKGYYLKEREFTTAEIRLLIDAVFSFGYISEAQTKELLGKLRNLVSEYDKKKFNYSSIVSTEKKTSNPEIIHNIELLDNAISHNNKISFVYYDYDYDKKLKPRHNEPYIANPYRLIFDSGNYYLAAITDKHPEIGYYRIDYIKNIKILEKPIDISPRNANIESIKKAVYAFSGEPKSIQIHCNKNILRYVIERFGNDTKIYKNPDGTFEAYVFAPLQGTLYWALQNLQNAEVITPKELRDEIRDIIKSSGYND